MSRLCLKACISPLDFLSTKLVINSQGDREGAPVQYTEGEPSPARVLYGRTLAVALAPALAASWCIVRWRVRVDGQGEQAWHLPCCFLVYCTGAPSRSPWPQPTLV